jgi:hypothetical protein
VCACACACVCVCAWVMCIWKSTIECMVCVHILCRHQITKSSFTNFIFDLLYWFKFEFSTSLIIQILNSIRLGPYVTWFDFISGQTHPTNCAKVQIKNECALWQKPSNNNILFWYQELCSFSVYEKPSITLHVIFSTLIMFSFVQNWGK